MKCNSNQPPHENYNEVSVEVDAPWRVPTQKFTSHLFGIYPLPNPQDHTEVRITGSSKPLFILKPHFKTPFKLFIRQKSLCPNLFSSVKTPFHRHSWSRVAARMRRRSNPSGKRSQERLTQGTVTSAVRKTAHAPGCAGAGCSAMKYQSLSGGI